MLSLCLHLSSFSLYLLITAMIVINYGLECVTCLGLAYIHISHIYCLIISLYWLFVNLESKRSLVFYTLSELSVYKDLNDWRLDIIAFIGEFFFFVL